MKIYSILNNNFKQKRINETNINSGLSELSAIKQPYQQDRVTFGAKIPSIVSPTMEDLINRTRAVDILRFNVLRLAKFNVPCPVCGHLMLDVDKFNAFENKVMATTNPGELLKLVGELKQYLHPVELKMYKMMKNMHSKNQQKTLHDMLRTKLRSSEMKIVQEQSKILINLSNISRKFPLKKSLKLQELINETYSRILDPRETSRFSRKIFLNKLKEVMGIVQVDKNGIIKETLVFYSPLQQRMMTEAAKLPTAYNNEDAFIVKYAKRNYNKANPDQKIALRMLSNSLATVEHIKAQKLKGDTSPENLALECACCNNKKNHDSVLEQVIENPMMILNYPRYMYRLCEIHLMGKVEKAYITQQNKTFKNDSYGLLDANLNLIRYPYTKGKKYTVKKDDVITIEEKRTGKKEKRIKSKHLKRIERSKNQRLNRRR